MWLNNQCISDAAIYKFRQALLNSRPQHLVIDGLFNDLSLRSVCKELQQTRYWVTQKHTYSALYVSDDNWQKSPSQERFVQRDVWQYQDYLDQDHLDQEQQTNIAQTFLSYLRSDAFMLWLSRIFDTHITDLNVAKPNINTNYFRLNKSDFVRQHADDSPGRVVCMLLYLNEGWTPDNAGELVFAGGKRGNVSIAPLYNRCVLFDPSSEGAEHWVNSVNNQSENMYRYNVTSWYWSE